MMRNIVGDIGTAFNKREVEASEIALRAFNDGDFPKAAVHFKKAAEATEYPFNKFVYNGYVANAVRKSLSSCGSNPDKQQVVGKLGAALSLYN